MIVNACLRDGRGGSPTTVVPDGDFTDAERQALPTRYGTSHAVFIGPGNALRFFTSEGELPGCGHGTVAALAVLAADGQTEFILHAGSRPFAGTAVRTPHGVEAFFDPGPVQVRAARTAEQEAVLRALGTEGKGVIATLGRPRMLVEVPSADALAALTPDLDLLREVTDELGLLGCYAYSSGPDRYVARMFAPSIGVPEDIANANSTACLAAYLTADIAVDMGDSLGQPATVTAPAAGRVGGLAAVTA